MQTHNGHLARILHACTDQALNSALVQMELTAAQAHIMGYITHRKSPPCPRDIEEAFQLSHPTVSGILSRLEQKAFIEMRPDENDRRCKRIYMLPKGIELNEMMHQTIRSMEEKWCRISPMKKKPSLQRCCAGPFPTWALSPANANTRRNLKNDPSNRPDDPGILGGYPA